MRCSKKAIRSSEYSQCEGSKPEKQKPSSTQKKTMPLLKCKCGARILLIPDLKAMNKAIEKHLSEHRKTIKKSKIKSKVIDELRLFLIKQLLDLSSQSKRLDNEPEKTLVS